VLLLGLVPRAATLVALADARHAEDRRRLVSINGGSAVLALAFGVALVHPFGTTGVAAGFVFAEFVVASFVGVRRPRTRSSYNVVEALA